MVEILPKEVQVALFSATLPPDIQNITKGLMRDGFVKILVKKEELTLEGIKQDIVVVD